MLAAFAGRKLSPVDIYRCSRCGSGSNERYVLPEEGEISTRLRFANSSRTSCRGCEGAARALCVSACFV